MEHLCKVLGQKPDRTAWGYGKFNSCIGQKWPPQKNDLSGNGLSLLLCTARSLLCNFAYCSESTPTGDQPSVEKGKHTEHSVCSLMSCINTQLTMQLAYNKLKGIHVLINSEGQRSIMHFHCVTRHEGPHYLVSIMHLWISLGSLTPIEELLQKWGAGCHHVGIVTWVSSGHWLKWCHHCKVAWKYTATPLIKTNFQDSKFVPITCTPWEPYWMFWYHHQLNAYVNIQVLRKKKKNTKRKWGRQGNKLCLWQFWFQTCSAIFLKSRDCKFGSHR